jgi:hypothetical protein
MPERPVGCDTGFRSRCYKFTVANARCIGVVVALVICVPSAVFAAIYTAPPGTYRYQCSDNSLLKCCHFDSPYNNATTDQIVIPCTLMINSTDTTVCSGDAKCVWGTTVADANQVKTNPQSTHDLNIYIICCVLSVVSGLVLLYAVVVFIC